MLEMRDGLLEQFEAAEQQHEAYQLGMWAFIASEVMLFGGLFLAYTVYRYLGFQAFATASNHENLTLGAVNTAVLLTSSLTMAMAVHEPKARRRVALLLATALLGIGFLAVKAIEYQEKFAHHLVPGPNFAIEGTSDLGHAEIFYWLYFVMTGLHALHLVLGIVVVATVAWLVHRRTEMVGGTLPLELTGLYWHFIDVVWIFLFPAFYLVGQAHR